MFTRDEDMGIRLEIVNRDNIEDVWKMQIEAFSELLEKYKDYNMSPAAESFDKVLARFEQPWTTYYFINPLSAENLGALAPRMKAVLLHQHLA